MNDTLTAVPDAKQVFKQCGTCSQTFGHLLNREFGNTMVFEERALDPLAGGILNRGHQCGMLWGSALAIGAEACRRHENMDEVIAVAVTATQHIVDSFIKRTKTVNCREIIGHNLNSVFGLVSFMMKVMIKGMDNSQCFNMAEAWAPEAIQAGENGLSEEPIQLTQKPMSCAAEVVKRMGATDKEMLMVSGFAGGIGLSGNGCGALGAAIWMKNLKWCKDHPDENPPLFNNRLAKDILKEFLKASNDEMLCHTICEKHFDSIDDHTTYIKNGGCQRLIQTLAAA